MMLKAWRPKSAFEMGIFLEDDVEVSPFYFSWILFTLKKHLYDPMILSNMEDPEDIDLLLSSTLLKKLEDPLDSRWMGLSLYTPKLNEISYPSEPWNFQVEFTNYYQNKTHDSNKATSANIAGSTLANSTLIDNPLTSNNTAASMPAAFLMQLPCSWGSLYFPWWWLLFTKYAYLRVDHLLAEHNVPESRSTRWSHSWKK